MIAQKHNSRIIHVTSSLSRNGGGIPPVVWSLAQHTQTLGSESMVAGLKDEFFEADRQPHTIRVLAGKICGPRALGYSQELSRLLEAQVRPTDVVHTHGLWMYPSALAYRLSHRTGCKRVVSPHGMLEPWAIKRSRWKKYAAKWLFEQRNLQTADCLHALCRSEADNFRKFGLRNPIAIIPNGVELKKLQANRDKQVLLREYPAFSGKRVLLFLSRIHPKKGLIDLLHAWAAVRPEDKNWLLAVAGPNELNHEEELHKLADDLKIKEHIQFIGPAYGEKKAMLYSGADAFVLPSLSEGFSMAVLEAAAAKLPVLLTKECNFPELAAAGGAIETPAGRSGIESGLANLISLSEAQINLMGSRGLELVTRVYTWPAIAKEMIRVYDWLTDNGPMPECVRLN